MFCSGPSQGQQFESTVVIIVIISAYSACNDGILALFCREGKKAIAEDAMNVKGSSIQYVAEPN